MTSDKGIIFNIQHFSIHDGPGIRTTVFFKGCPLKCPWCSNPESQKIQPEEMLDINTNKNILVGEEKTVDQIINEVLKDIDFYEESNGGITLSGGEIFTQFEFAKNILKQAKKLSIHTAIETTAFTTKEKFKDLIQYADFIYTDLKHYDSDKHLKVVGSDNKLIIENITYAFKNNKNIILRIPVIPDFNNSLEDARQFSILLKKMKVNNVQLLPFHQYGENKYRLLNRFYKMAGYPNLHPEDLYEYRNIFLNNGINCYF